MGPQIPFPVWHVPILTAQPPRPWPTSLSVQIMYTHLSGKGKILALEAWPNNGTLPLVSTSDESEIDKPERSGSLDYLQLN